MVQALSQKVRQDHQVDRGERTHHRAQQRARQRAGRVEPVARQRNARRVVQVVGPVRRAPELEERGPHPPGVPDVVEVVAADAGRVVQPEGDRCGQDDGRGCQPQQSQHGLASRCPIRRLPRHARILSPGYHPPPRHAVAVPGSVVGDRCARGGGRRDRGAGAPGAGAPRSERQGLQPSRRALRRDPDRPRHQPVHAVALRQVRAPPRGSAAGGLPARRRQTTCRARSPRSASESSRWRPTCGSPGTWRSCPTARCW